MSDMVAQKSTDHLELEALYQVSQLIGSALDLNKALSEILRILHETLRMERATLVLIDTDEERLSIKASYGLTEEEHKRGVYKINEGIIGKIFQTAFPFVVPDIHSEPLFLNRTGARANLPKGEISFIGVPVVLLDKPVGVLTVDRLFGSEISFEEDIRFLTVVAMLIAQFLNLHEAIANKEKLLVEENESLKAKLKYRFDHRNIIGQSKIMREVFQAIDKVAPSRATILLLGESGTGKELVARAIHEASPRSDKPFIKVNCAALPENLLESELFGHEKGAFTGAVNRKMGRFELADNGTLFLDEIGELPLALQAKLLRALQEQQFERLGGTQTLHVNVRVIAATNRNLNDLVSRGEFRADLYYRLNVVPMVLPSLRERREDVPLLVDHFLRASNQINDRQVRMTREVMEFFLNYDWPGNVRELQNMIERLVIMADREWVRQSDLASYLPSYMLSENKLYTPPSQRDHVEQKTERSTSGRLGLMDIERNEVESALKRHGWVQARAARELGITSRQIGYRMKKFGIRPPSYLMPDSS